METEARVTNLEVPSLTSTLRSNATFRIKEVKKMMTSYLIAKRRREKLTYFHLYEDCSASEYLLDCAVFERAGLTRKYSQVTDQLMPQIVAIC